MRIPCTFAPQIACARKACLGCACCLAGAQVSAASVQRFLGCAHPQLLDCSVRERVGRGEKNKGPRARAPAPGPRPIGNGAGARTLCRTSIGQGLTTLKLGNLKLDTGAG